MAKLYRNLNRDGTLSENSDFIIPSQKAIKTYVDNSKPLKFTNISVIRSSFLSDNTYIDFPYKAEIILQGVTANMLPIVIFRKSDAESGMFSNIVESANGKVYIWANQIPQNDITIASIICQ